MVYKVSSEHFDYHPALEACSFAEAIALAKKRGFEARIVVESVLVATWSALYGTHIYNRELAQ